MRLYFAPLLWLTMGALPLAFNASMVSRRFRDRLSRDRLAQVQKAYGQNLMSVWIIVTGVYCTYAAIRTLVSGVDTWWLWFLAAVAQFGNLPVRRVAGIKLGAGELQPAVESQRRHRRVLWITVPAFACLLAAQPVAESAARLDNGLMGAASILLMIAALAGFIAAGWAAVWVSSNRMPDQEVASPPPHN